MPNFNGDDSTWSSEEFAGQNGTMYMYNHAFNHFRSPFPQSTPQYIYNIIGKLHQPSHI